MDDLQALFEDFAATSNAVLLKEQKKSGPLFSLDFMHWLDEAEHACTDAERKEQLGALAGVLPASCHLGEPAQQPASCKCRYFSSCFGCPLASCNTIITGCVACARDVE